MLSCTHSSRSVDVIMEFSQRNMEVTKEQTSQNAKRHRGIQCHDAQESGRRSIVSPVLEPY